MSSRFHNKYHRHNHHTAGIEDPRYPDAAHDPIASPDSPFLGDFVMLGTLSAIGSEQYSDIPSQPAGVFTAAPSGAALLAYGSVGIDGSLSASDITFTGNVLQTFVTPVTANGEFLEVNINSQIRYIRLWQS